MELLTILAADYANIAEGSKLNVMGIFKNIYASAFPARHLSTHLVVKLGAELGEFGDNRMLTISLHEPDGKELMNFVQGITVPIPSDGQRPEINLILKIDEIVFPMPGRYQFNVKVDKDVKGSLPIDVILIPQDPKIEEQP